MRTHWVCVIWLLFISTAFSMGFAAFMAAWSAKMLTQLVFVMRPFFKTQAFDMGFAACTARSRRHG